jgi:MarR family transcriptional regulator, organic hydroperoxide resistance regulator
MVDQQSRPLAGGVGLLLVQICRAHRNHVSAALDALGIHAGQDHTLCQVAVREGTAQSELAEALCVDPSTVTKTLARLERDGLVERHPDPADARVSRVYLTGRGRELVQPVMAIWNRTEARLVDGLDETERALLRRLLLQVLGNLT